MATTANPAIDAANGEAVETDHHVTVAADIGLCAIGLLVDKRVAPQELVQRGMAAIERIGQICRGQFPNGCVAMAQPSPPGSRSNLFRRGLLCTGRSNASWNACHCGSSSRN